MIVYLDASALVKRYVAEAGSPEAEALIGEAQATGTAVISRAEVAAALARAARVGLVTREARAAALAWSEALGETVAVATYDRELWRGGKASGLSVWPAAMP